MSRRKRFYYSISKSLCYLCGNGSDLHLIGAVGFPSNQSRLSVIIRYLIIFFSLAFQLYTISFSFFQLGRVTVDPNNKFQDIVNDAIILGDRPLNLFVWFYFLRYRADIQAFFSDWGRMEQQFTKGFDSATIKRTVIIIYSVYYTYGFLFLFVELVPLS